MFKTWFGLTLDAVLLGFETQRVMGLAGENSGGRTGGAGRGAAHGHGENGGSGRSGDDTGDRWLRAEGRSPLPHPRQGE